MKNVEYLVDFDAIFEGLMGDKMVADHLLHIFSDLFRIFRQLYTSLETILNECSFPAASRQDLRFHHVLSEQIGGLNHGITTTDPAFHKQQLNLLTNLKTSDAERTFLSGKN